MSTSPVTLFNSLSVSFNGIGTQCQVYNGNFDSNLSEIIPPTFNIVKLLVAIADPGLSFILLNTYDSLYTDEAVSTPFAQTITDLNNLNVKIILNVQIPHSWLTTGSLSSAQAITSYARLVVSGFNYFVNVLHANLFSIEVFTNPDLSPPHISAPNLVSLVSQIQSIAVTRGFPVIPLSGPSVSQLSAQTVNITDANYVYTQAQPNFTIWSIYGKENNADLAIINGNNFLARQYFMRQSDLDAVQFGFTKPYQEKVITNLATRATVYPQGTIPVGVNASETVGYGCRVAENIIGALSNSYTSLLLGKLNFSSLLPLDTDSLYDSEDLHTQLYQIATLVSQKLIVNGQIFQGESLDPNDETMKVCVISSDHFSFTVMLSRPSIDPYNGNLTFNIQDKIWSDALQFTSFTFTAYPSTVDVSLCSVTFSDIPCAGLGVVKVNNLPLNCIIFFSGTLAVTPAPAPPSPIPPNYLSQTVIQIFINNNLPTGVFAPGTIFFNLSTNKTMVYDSVLGWIEITLYTGP